MIIPQTDQTVKTQTITLTCNITHQTFDADLAQLRAVNVVCGRAVFWLACPYCDANGHPSDHPDYNPDEPQMLAYMREEAQP